MDMIAEEVRIVETDFAHHERQRREIRRVLATLAEMAAREARGPREARKDGGR